MPFDAIGFLLPNNHITDRLVAIGVTPVPASVVNEHKQKIVKDFASSILGRSLVRSGAAVWRTLHLYRDLDILDAPRKYLGTTNDVSAAPRALVDLANRVARDIGDAEFEMEWFYTDPVLNVVCGSRKACLGIWDNGRIVAMAGHDGYVPPPAPVPMAKSFWRRWLPSNWF